MSVPAGSSFEALLEGAPTGLVGGLGIQVDRVSDGATVIAHTTSGITEVEPGSGAYSKMLTAPSLAGTYVIIWDYAAVTATEYIEVAIAPVGSAYVSLGEIKDSLTLPSGVTYADADIDAAIRASSRAIDKMCDRKFWLDLADVTRTYVPSAPAALRIDDLATFVSLTVGGSAWVEGTDFYLTPTNAVDDGEPYTMVKPIGGGFSYYGSNANVAGADARVQLVGRFGWPAIPDDVTEACRILTVRLMRRVREASFGVIGFGFEGEVIRIARLDPDVQTLLEPYRRLLVA